MKEVTTSDLQLLLIGQTAKRNRQGKSVTAYTVASFLSCTPVTARRYLKVLAETGHIVFEKNLSHPRKAFCAIVTRQGSEYLSHYQRDYYDIVSRWFIGNSLVMVSP